MIHEVQLTLVKSLRRCRISKLPLTAHKVLQTPNRCRLFRWYWLFTFKTDCIIRLPLFIYKKGIPYVQVRYPQL